MATQSEDAAASPATDVAARKQAAINIDDEGNQNKKQVAASKKKAAPKKRAAKAAAKATAKAAAKAAVAPAPDVACNLQDEGTTKVDFERQAHHFPAASDVAARKQETTPNQVAAFEGHQTKKEKVSIGRPTTVVKVSPRTLGIFRIYPKTKKHQTEP